MKLLLAATPARGHLNPLLAIARMAKARGDEVIVTTSSPFASAVKAVGARFIALAAGADLDLREVEKMFPERASLPPGPVQLRFDFERGFLDPMEPQAATLRAIMAAEAPDVIVADSLFCGTTPLFLDFARPRPPIVACGVTFLPLDRPDGAPAGPGLPPARDDADRERYAALAAEVDALLTRPVREYADRKLAAMGLPGLPCPFLPSRVLLADAYLLPTVPAFEYDFGPLPPQVRFVGALPPPPPGEARRPDWWGELDGSRRVVLVTQGTAANHNFGHLVEPTLAALADRDDLLVVVTTGGRPVENVRGPVPANARIAPFLNYEELLPKLSCLVTNGGYGTVSLALQAGVPIVAAGRTEDKAEVGARVAWSGVGVELASDAPGVKTLRGAISRVLDEPSYRNRARAISAEFAALDARREVFAVMDDLVATGLRGARASRP